MPDLRLLLVTESPSHIDAEPSADMKAGGTSARSMPR
jgi:hypothetical protein